MTSLLYVGRLVHARLRPLRHAFVYPIHVVSVDLAELPALDRRVALFGYNRLRPLSLWDRDYLDAGPGSVHDKLMRLLARRGCADGIHRTRLVTVGRCFHYAYNPINFYYCYGADGALRCVVVEVNNTYGERHAYLLPGPARRHVVPKAFYVSPFNDLSGDYHFDLGAPGDAMDIRIDLVRAGATVLQTRLSGTPRSLDNGSIVRTLLRYPLAAALTLPRIHWQALALRSKGLRTLMKPNPTGDMTLRTAPPRRRARVAPPGARKRATP